MLDYQKYLQDVKGRNRLLGQMGLTFLALFVVWNTLLGFNAASRFDLWFVEVAGGWVDKPWISIEKKYGDDLARVAFLLKIRVVAFMCFELPALVLFLLLSGAWEKFLVPFPTMKEDTQSLIDQGKLRATRGFTQMEWLKAAYYLQPLGGRAGLAGVGVRDASLVILVFFLVFLVILLIVPFEPEYHRHFFRRRHFRVLPELNAVFLFLTTMALIVTAPLFVVTLGRKLLKDADPG